MRGRIIAFSLVVVVIFYFLLRLAGDRGHRDDPPNWADTLQIQKASGKGAWREVKGDPQPLNLIWLVNPLPPVEGGSILEANWIKDVLLSGIGRPIIQHWMPRDFYSDMGAGKVDATHPSLPVINNSLVVMMSFWLNASHYVDRVKREGARNVGIYYMGNEKRKYGLEWTHKADYAFINYCCYTTLPSTAYYVPLGMKSGLVVPAPNTLPKTSTRPNLCMFWGSTGGREWRLKMIEDVEAQGIKCDVRLMGWETTGNPTQLEYSAAIENAKFMMSPFGGNPESLRIYEALSYGSIPIITRLPKQMDFLRALDPDHPIPVVDSWDSAEVKRIVTAPDWEQDALQEKIAVWWKAKRAEVVAKIGDTVSASFRKFAGG